MTMQKVIEKRRSVREYKHKELESADIELLRELVENVPKLIPEVEVKFHFAQNGREVFQKLQGVAGYHGVMIEAPHYLVVLANADQNQYVAAGYGAEWLVLQLSKAEIGTCWIHSNKNEDQIKSALGLETVDQVIALMAVGYPAMDVRLSNIYDTMRTGSVSSLSSLGYPHVDVTYHSEPVSGRVSITDLIYLKQWGECLTVEELEQRGLAETLFYMRLAPSWGNQQPWRFIVDKCGIRLAVKKEYGAEDEHVADIDAGIAMLYFQTAMRFDGYPGNWELTKECDGLVVPEDYKLISCYVY